MENFSDKFSLNDFKSLSFFKNHRLTSENYSNSFVSLSLSREHLSNNIEWKRLCIPKIENIILEAIFVRLEVSKNLDFLDARFEKSKKFSLKEIDSKNIILNNEESRSFREYIVNNSNFLSHNPFLVGVDNCTKSSFFEICKFYGQTIYSAAPYFSHAFQSGNYFLAFDEIYFDICEFDYYISEDYYNLLNFKINFKYYVSVINPVKIYLIEDSSSPMMDNFREKLRDNTISKILEI